MVCVCDKLATTPLGKVAGMHFETVTPAARGGDDRSRSAEIPKVDGHDERVFR